MADRFPLIANTSANQIQELSASDNLDLTGNSIVGLSTITVGSAVTMSESGIDVTGIVTSTSFSGSAASLTSIPAANIVGLATAGFERTGGFGGGAYEYVSKTTITSSANYFDITGFDDNTIYYLVGKKVTLSSANWPEFSFLDNNGASGNRSVSHVRCAFYTSGGSGSTGVFGGTNDTRPNTWPGVSSLQHSFTLLISTPAINSFFMWDGVATDQTNMAYGITRGSLYANSGTNRIHGVRFHAGGGSTRTFDSPTEVIVYKLKES